MPTQWRLALALAQGLVQVLAQGLPGQLSFPAAEDVEAAVVEEAEGGKGGEEGSAEQPVMMPRLKVLLLMVVLLLLTILIHRSPHQHGHSHSGSHSLAGSEAAGYGVQVELVSYLSRFHLHLH